MTKFKVGDRVRVVDFLHNHYEGCLATVKAVTTHDPYPTEYSVETDVHTGGHTGYGNLRHGHGWWLTEELMEMADPDTPFYKSLRSYLNKELNHAP